MGRNNWYSSKSLNYICFSLDMIIFLTNKRWDPQMSGKISHENRDERNFTSKTVWGRGQWREVNSSPHEIPIPKKNILRKNRHYFLKKLFWGYQYKLWGVGERRWEKINAHNENQGWKQERLGFTEMGSTSPASTYVRRCHP